MSVFINQVVLAVRDQQAALEFWTRAMDYEVVTDTPYGDERWIELQAPGHDLRMVLSLEEPGTSTRWRAGSSMPNAPMMFSCSDLDATYEQLKGRGVAFPTPPTDMPFGRWAVFSDDDGHRFGLGETATQ